MGLREKLRESLGRPPTEEEIQAAKTQRAAAKEQKVRVTPVGGSRAPPEDWDCQNCSARCFGDKASCFKCGTKRGYSSPESKKHRRREGAYDIKASSACEDKMLTCKVCTAEFVFTAGEQEYFLKKGFLGVERARCPDCAKAKRMKTIGTGTGTGDESSSSSKKPTCGGRLICFAWQQGACSHGNSCKFAHGEPDGVLEASAVSPRAKSESTSQIKCFHCNAEGHRVADCPKAKAQREAAEKAAQKATAGTKKKKKKKRNRNGTLPTANKPTA